VNAPRRLFVFALAAVALSGCANYSWKPVTPEWARTVCVPTFRNESDVTELGSVMTRQLLREFQREGTFKIRREDDAVLEIQGVVESAGSSVSSYDRTSGMRLAAHEFTAVVVVSVIDKRNGRVLVDNRKYRAAATFTAGQDLTTAMRDASGRLSEDLARQVVDDVTGLSL